MVRFSVFIVGGSLHVTVHWGCRLYVQTITVGGASGVYVLTCHVPPYLGMYDPPPQAHRHRHWHGGDPLCVLFDFLVMCSMLWCGGRHAVDRGGGAFGSRHWGLACVLFGAPLVVVWCCDMARRAMSWWCVWYRGRSRIHTSEVGLARGVGELGCGTLYSVNLDLFVLHISG